MTLIGTSAMVLATHAESPCKSFDDVVVAGRGGKAPGDRSIGTVFPTKPHIETPPDIGSPSGPRTFGMLTDRFGISWAVSGEPIPFG